MAKKDLSFITTGLYYWLELQIATAFSLLSSFSVTILRFFVKGNIFAENMVTLVADLIVVFLLIVWLFSREAAKNADTLGEYLLPCVVAFPLHCLFALIPFITSVGLSTGTLAKLILTGFRPTNIAPDISFGTSFLVFCLLCLPKFGAVVSAYYYRRHRDRRKKEKNAGRMAG